MKIKISPELRIFVTGRTQTGKTSLVKLLTKLFFNVLIYDIKREYGGFGAVVHSLQALKLAFMRGCTRVVYQPEDFSAEHFDEVCGFIWNNKIKNLVFVVDEVHKYCTKHKIPPNFNTILTVMQSYGVGVISITQRPANVHNDVLSSSTLTICFKLQLLSDALAVSNNTGIPANEIQALELYHFFIFDDRTGEYNKHLPI